MSDSDEDFFQATQLPPRTNVSVSCKVSVVEYFFLVTFDWNLLIGNPFEIYVLEAIKEFPEDWIKGPLTKENRLQKQAISACGGGKYSLFCKVEKGSFTFEFCFIKFHI